MLIQNVNSAVQVPQPTRLSSNGGSRVVDASGFAQEASPQPSPQQLKMAVDSINLALSQANKSMELSIDSTTHSPVVKITDSETGELIRQYPSKEVLAIAQGIDQFLSRQGRLLSKEA